MSLLMIYLTQLIYLNPGKEKDFNDFEFAASEIIRKYNGIVMFRYKPAIENFIELAVEVPYEVQMVSFPSEADLRDYMNDQDRALILHLKKQSVDSYLAVKGYKV